MIYGEHAPVLELDGGGVANVPVPVRLERWRGGATLPYHKLVGDVPGQPVLGDARAHAVRLATIAIRAQHATVLQQREVGRESPEIGRLRLGPGFTVVERVGDPHALVTTARM